MTAISRAFAYNPTSSIVHTGTTQVGNISIETTGFLAGVGGLQWFNGPDESNGYIITHVSGPSTAANTTMIISATTIGFRKSSANDTSFINLSQYVSQVHGSPQTFSSGSNAKTWLNNNGYWTSYITSIVTTDLTLRLDATDSSSYPGSGLTWFDLAPPQQNITLSNTPTYTSGTPAYFTFNPAAAQRGTGTGTGVVPTTSYTKSVWFYINSLLSDNNLVSSSTGGHFMYLAGSNKLYCGHANWGNYAAYPSVGTFSASTWYCATLTFNTTDGMKLYINGVLDSTYTANKAAHAGDGSTNIAHFGGGNFLNGRIGKVYCYNRSLTASEVLQNFNADKTHFGLV